MELFVIRVSSLLMRRKRNNNRVLYSAHLINRTKNSRCKNNCMRKINAIAKAKIRERVKVKERRNLRSS